MAEKAFISSFTPSRTDPDTLEKIFVQRETMLGRTVELLRDSVLTRNKHHLLFVGPRGVGKSNLVSLAVHRLRRDPALVERMRIAWLPEDESTTSFVKLLLRILRSLHAVYPSEFSEPSLSELRDLDDVERARRLTQLLLEHIADRTLLVVVENLDAVLDGLKDEGRKRWRAFLQEHPISANLATSQQLTDAVSNRSEPFFGFFQIQYLKPLSRDDAAQLLRKIAALNADEGLASFLQTATGRARVRALWHLSGGSHRVYIVLSEFITQESLDELVQAFEELIDELTPFYQERLRWLPEQQREIVEYLCLRQQTAAVKDIARDLFLEEKSLGKQLKNLSEKGYVIGTSVGRESRYELAEPLMRLCVEVKDNRREPIRLIVEFLRTWYDRDRVEQFLQTAGDSPLAPARRYVEAALEQYDREPDGPVLTNLRREIASARDDQDTSRELELMQELAEMDNSAPNWINCGRALVKLNRFGEAIESFDRALKCDPNHASAWFNRGYALGRLGRQEEALVAFVRALELDPNHASAWFNRGNVLSRLGRDDEALTAFDRALELDPNHASAWFNRGYAAGRLGRDEEALTAYDRALGLDPNHTSARFNRGYAAGRLGRHEEALAAFDRVLELDPNRASAWFNRGNALGRLGRHEEALAAFDRVLELDPNRASAWSNRGNALGRLDRDGEALAAYDRALELDPSNAHVWNAKACSLNLLGRFEEAVECLRLGALCVNSSGSRVRETLAEALAALGRWDESFGTLQEWLGNESLRSQLNLWGSEQLVHRMFLSTNDRTIWQERVNRLVGLCWDTATLPYLGNSLVRSLTLIPKERVELADLDDWLQVWQQAGGVHAELELPLRLYAVGLRYRRSNDRRVLFDLLQEERRILFGLFGLDEENA